MSTPLIRLNFFSHEFNCIRNEVDKMKYDIRGSIKKLKKLAKLKENARIKDRLIAVVFHKKVVDVTDW